MNVQQKKCALALFAVMILLSQAYPAEAGRVRIIKATASSEKQGHPASLAIDGDTGDASRWVSKTEKEGAWLEVQFDGVKRLGGVHLHSGSGAGGMIEDFVIRFRSGDAWKDIPSAEVSGNQSTRVAIPFDQTVDVVTDRLRLEVRKTHQGIARVKELVVWDASGEVPELKSTKRVSQSEIPPLYLNQSGFNRGKPKRFTAPLMTDGTPFIVREKEGKVALFKGEIRGRLGDFSGFDGAEGRLSEYVIEAGGVTSVPFSIGNWWLERVTYQNAVNFMIDTRHYVGNYTKRCQGSYGWRDDTTYAWELNTLIPQYFANPSAYDRMPRQISYQRPTKPKLWGALQPYAEECPDLIKLIHWGADVIVSQGLSHQTMKTQLPYFLHAWPVLRQHLPEQNYQVVRDYTFRVWAANPEDKHNMLALKTTIGTTKGEMPPGFTVQPNLLLYEVAKREKRPEAEDYFKAAHEQATWMIKDLNWNDPLATKGQRVSEFITITGLAYFLKTYPDRAPAGLQKKLEEWVAVAVRRSENLWDFRKLGDGEDQWTPMGEKPTMWNEPGNVVGVPALLLSVKPWVKDHAIRKRLDQLVWSHFDNMFGRNPVGRHFSYDAPDAIEGVEHGWFAQHAGGIGQLSEARFVLDGAPKNGHYPYAPERGNYGWTEGWIQHNVPFNLSLAYLAYDDTSLELEKTEAGVLIRLTAPLNFDYTTREEGTVQVMVNGVCRPAKVLETACDSPVLTVEIPAKPGDRISAAYGYGYFEHAASITR